MHVERDKIDLFENWPVPKAVLTLTVPMVVSCLVMVLYNLADTFFVGFLNDPVQTSAVTLAAPVILAFNAVINLFGVGCGSLISRALGKKDYDIVKRTSAFGFYGAIICGVLFAVVCTVLKPFLLVILGADEVTSSATGQYLFWTVSLGAVPSILSMVLGQIIRSEGSAVRASIGAVGGCILNIFLDPVFILPWGLNMGAAGAGCATFISNFLSCAYYVLLLTVGKKKSFISISPKYFRVTKILIKDVCIVGIPAAIQNLLNVTGMTLLNNLMSFYGSEAVAAIGIAHKLAMIPMFFAMGLSQGAMPLVGYNYSAKNKKRMRDAVLFAGKIEISVSIVFAVFFIVFSKDIVGLFITNALVVSYGGSFLIGQSIAQPLLGMDFLGVGVFQACGMGKRALVFAILRKIVLEIPALYILNNIFPMYGLAYACVVAETVLCIAAIIQLKKIIKIQ